MAYILAAFMLFVIVAILAFLFVKSSPRYTQIAVKDLDMIFECFKEIYDEAGKVSKVGLTLDAAGSIENIRRKALMGKYYSSKSKD